ncbi:hypothetical protein TrVE_jg2887 [Triparma verrucosa]|uniref:Methyltransferase domain-containing protein n=1 Tax=Triparma verrucosa TaxID=1606542 RepID=A0A9W7CA27_9STRA|nr:hypothetical protein TrVE_jg2887 [Triparma verrucosa]
MTSAGAPFITPALEPALEPTPDDTTAGTFKSAGLALKEDSTSFTASRDTNISPGEAYSTISSPLIKSSVSSIKQSGRSPSCVDFGAGAGVSTQILWDLGIKSIDAVDWSSSAWTKYVSELGVPNALVKFYEMDDSRFLSLHPDNRYDFIVFNFAVNESKAKLYAKKYLLQSPTSLLLAPINTNEDYWLKQNYVLMDFSGKIIKSEGEVGAWSVQFQPDVTEPTCSGIWCPPFNTFVPNKNQLK